MGGHAKVPMAALKTVFEEAGATNVVTYIQSGNVAFDGPTSLNAKRLATAIEKHFKLNVAVTVRTHAQLGKVIDDCPFDDPSVTHVGFLTGKLKAHDVDVSQFAPSTYAEHGDEVYFYLPDGLGTSKMMAFLGRRLGEMTVRNWNTVTKMFDLTKKA